MQQNITFLQKRANWQLLLAVILFTTFAFNSSFDNEFTNWDDDDYVTNNEMIKNLNFLNIKRVFSEPVSSNYHPLTVLSLAINHQIGGQNPFSYHLVNFLLHLLNCILVFYLILKLFPHKKDMAFIVAMLFAIHPMHVESVVWISARKDVLYAAFFLAAMITYVDFIKKQQWNKYLLSLFLFVLALLSKPAAVILPLNLLLLYYLIKQKIAVKPLIQLLPFFGLSLIFGLITIYFQSFTAIQTETTFSFFEKIVFSSYAFVMYVIKAVIPFQLNHFYPYPVDGAAISTFQYASIFIMLAFIGVLAFFRKNKIILFGGLFFIVNILLVLQLVQVGFAIMAERYTYVSYIGLFLILAYVFHWLIQQPRFQKNALNFHLVLGLIFVLFTFISSQRSEVWQDSFTLWTDNLQKTPNPTGYNNRGNFYFFQQNFEMAIQEYQKAIALAPKSYMAYKNLGLAHINLKQFAEAEQQFQKAIQNNPNYTSAYLDLAKSYLYRGMYQPAIAPLNTYLATVTNDAYAYNARGLSYFYTNQVQQALVDYNKALQLNPKAGQYYFNRAQALEKLGNKQAARQDVQKAQQLGIKINGTFLQKLQ